MWVVGLPGNARKKRQLERRGVTVIQAPAGGPRVPLRWAVRELWRRGVRSLMVEGGSELLGAFLAARLVDVVALYRAPLLLGGRDGVPAFGGPAPSRLSGGLAVRARAPSALFELWYPVASR